MTERQQYITSEGLGNWSKCYLVTDNVLVAMPSDLVSQLSGHLQTRWIDLSKNWYDEPTNPPR